MNRIRPLTVIFCLPGSPFSSNFLVSWTELLMSLPRNNIIPMLSSKRSSNVYFVRNLCLGGNVLGGIDQRPFGGQQDYDYIMWIDSDVVFRPEHFYQLLSHEEDIVSGIYMMENGRQFAVVEDWDEKHFLEHGTFHFLDSDDMQKRKAPFPVAYTGMGFMLVKKGVFESIGYPWCRPVNYEFSEEVKDFSSEDAGFCHVARAKGFSVLVDPSVRVGHEKALIL